MKEKQITFNAKTHSLDSNDNFSLDGHFLCYDTRGVVSPKGDKLAYNIKVAEENSTLIIDGKVKNEFDQIFILELTNFSNTET